MPFGIQWSLAMKMEMLTDVHSAHLHSETETPGSLFNRDTLEIIRFRYDFAVSYMEGKDVLEIGSGTGLGLKYFGCKATSIIGGEFSEENIRLCRKLHGTSVTVVSMDAHRIPYPDCSFDVVVALAMVYYLRLDEFLSEARRILRPGGLLLFCTSNKNVSGFVPAPYTIKYYSVPELSNILRQSEFDPSFFGAFKAVGGSVLISRVRGSVKAVVKRIVHLFPRGESFWRRIRHQSLGETFPLPSDVSLIPPSCEKLIPLEETRVDHIHRILYVAARKID